LRTGQSSNEAGTVYVAVLYTSRDHVPQCACADAILQWRNASTRLDTYRHANRQTEWTDRCCVRQSQWDPIRHATSPVHL